MCVLCFFFKQKTAYEMRISDWSSDVCSSDLFRRPALGIEPRPEIRRRFGDHEEGHQGMLGAAVFGALPPEHAGIVGAQRDPIHASRNEEIGRASCRERVCQYV